MANELTLTGSLAFAKAPVATVNMLKSGVQFTVAGTNYARQTVSVGTSSFVALDIGAITTAGYIFVQNNDTTNYVELAASTSASGCVKLLPGEFAIFRCATSTLSAKAHTAACVIEYILIEA
jgi:hypothetical protein